MECVIPGSNVKVFAKTLNALAKVGDCIFLDAYKDKLSIHSINLRKTVWARFYFKDNFFSSYNIEPADYNNEEKVICNCKVQLKTILPLFKGLNIEKKFDYVKIQFDNSDFIVIKMKYSFDDIVMVNKLKLMTPEILSLELSLEDGPNNLVCSKFSQILNTFSSTDDEISLEVSVKKVIVRNYTVGAPPRPSNVRSQVNLYPSDFISLDIKVETIVNFPLKPLRTAIQFAELFNLDISMNFGEGGRHLTLIMTQPTFEGNFILGTVDAGNSTLSTLPSKITPTNSERMNVTAEDKQVMMDIDWENEEELSGMNEEPSKNRNGQNNLQNEDVLPPSPESSPIIKKAKIVFGRCVEATFSKSVMLEDMDEILAPDSDPDTE